MADETIKVNKIWIGIISSLFVASTAFAASFAFKSDTRIAVLEEKASTGEKVVDEVKESLRDLDQKLDRVLRKLDR